jgi:acyl-CoA thioester hydrolase
MGRHGCHGACEQHGLLRYLETVRIDYFQSIGCVPNPQGQGPVIVNAFCNFYKQLEYPGNVLAKMYVSDPAAPPLRVGAPWSWSTKPGVIYAAGGATTIWVDFPLQKAVNLPDDIRARVTP